LAAGLVVGSAVLAIARVAVLGTLVLIAAAVLNADRNTPSAVLILLGVVVVPSFATTRTPFGRHLYAVGGNP